MSAEGNEKEIKEYFDFYITKVLPKIRTIEEVTQKDYGYHGLLTHTEGVVFRGIYFASSLNKNPYPVIFACAAHDLARTDDEYNEIHGPRAIPIVSKLMDMFGDLLTKKEKEQVKYAVKNHTIGTIAPDYISGCTRDADRTRLSRERTYDEKFFNTEPGKKIASGTAEDFLEFENKCLGRDPLIDNEGILQKKHFINKMNSLIKLIFRKKINTN